MSKDLNHFRVIEAVFAVWGTRDTDWWRIIKRLCTTCQCPRCPILEKTLQLPQSDLISWTISLSVPQSSYSRFFTLTWQEFFVWKSKFYFASYELIIYVFYSPENKNLILTLELISTSDKTLARKINLISQSSNVYFHGFLPFKFEVPKPKWYHSTTTPLAVKAQIFDGILTY